METIALGFALIRDRAEAGSRWLMRQPGCAGMLSLICGDRLEEESFRETVTREVAWQLDLERNREFLVSNMAQINLEFEGMMPDTDDPAKMVVAFYTVDLYRQSARDRINERKDLLWVPSADLCEQSKFEGRMINPFHQALINRCKVIESWH